MKPIAVGRFVVRHLIDARREVVDPTALKPIPDPRLTNAAERRTATDGHSDTVWARAREEERLIGPLLGNSDPKARIGVAQALGLSERQIRRKLKRYEALHSIDAFLPLRRGPLPGPTSVHPDVESLMAEEIRAALTAAVADCVGTSATAILLDWC